MALRIATFNIENFGGGTAEVLAARTAVLRPQLLRLRADVVCLQEVNARRSSGGERALDELDDLLADTPYADFARVASHSRSGDHPTDRHNTVILSRLPVLASRQLWHDRVPPLQWRTMAARPPAATAEAVTFDRPIVHAELALPDGRTLHVVHLHLRAPRAAFVPGGKANRDSWASVAAWAEGFYLAMLKRTGQAFETRLLLEELFDAEPTALVAVCGDFNADDRDSPVRMLRAIEEDTGSGELAGRVLVPVDRGIPADRRFSVQHHGRAQMLDHILVSRALLGHLRHAEVHNEALGDEVVSPARVSASPDTWHAPLVAEFELGG